MQVLYCEMKFFYDYNLWVIFNNITWNDAKLVYLCLFLVLVLYMDMSPLTEHNFTLNTPTPPPHVASQIIINQSLLQHVLVIFIFLVLTTNWFQIKIASLMTGIIHWQTLLVLHLHLVSLSVRLMRSDCPISCYFMYYWLYVSLILICLSDCDCFNSFLYLAFYFTFVRR